MLAIFVGILVEQMAAEGRLDVLERRELSGFPVTLGSSGDKAMAVCRTGVGEERGAAAAEAVFEEVKPSAVLSLRMATSVSDDLRAGDLVLCRRISLCGSDYATLAAPSEADRRLLALAEQAARGTRLQYVLGGALTAARLISDPLDRALVPEGYAVVDTEGHSLASAAAECGLPFVAVRAALGRSFDRVPDTLELVAQRGVIRPWRTLGRYALRPAKIGAFLGLAVAVRRASRALSRFSKEFLREWRLEP